MDQQGRSGRQEAEGQQAVARGSLPGSQGAAAPPPAGDSWVLALSVSSGLLTCFLSDCQSRFQHASAPWPPAAGAASALPAPVLQAIAEGNLQSVRLQLDPGLDHRNWEAELERARAGLRVSRHLNSAQPAFPPAATAAPEPPEWRQVTTLSIDLIQSTGLLHEWGAERYAENHEAFHQLCRRLVEEQEGRLDDPQGDDGLMAYFGLRRAREDAAARAVRAAWALVGAVPAIGFGVRIGITTGRVAVSSGLPFGAVIHLAARLQRIAPANGIVVSEATHALLGPGVVCERLPEPVQLAGFAQPQVGWRVVRVESAQTAHWQRQGEARFVGRQPELALLNDAWAQVRASGRGRYRCLLGEPGIGKTRLLREFEHALRASGAPATVLRVAGYQDLQSSAFAALAMALPGTPLHDLVPRLQAGDLGTDGRATPEPPALERPERNPVAELVARCRELARRAPLCVIVDDAQWLDPSTIDFVERLRLQAAEVPLLLVASLRDDARSRLRGLHTRDAITLAALGLRDSIDLVGLLSATAPLSREMGEFIASRAGGIPLFLEETVRMVAQLGSGSPALAEGIPATLEDLLMARLDALGPAKAMAQLAAVLGTEFPLSLWDEVLREPDDWVQRARAPEAWQRLADAGVLAVLAGEPPRCRFRHALIRDAAYESLWGRDRKRLHGVVAKVLQRHAVPGGSALRAHHLAAAGDTDAACGAWALAAREAAAAGADREALVASQRALALLQELPETPEARHQALQLHLLQAARSIALDGYGANSVESAYLRAAALCNEAEAGSMRIRVDLGLEACYAMRGDLARARALAETAVQSTPWSGNLRLALQARWAWTNVAFHQGDIVAALDMAQQCLARYDTTLHHPGVVQDPAIMFLCYSAWGLFQQGWADQARSQVRCALELAQQLDHPFSQAIAHGFAASVALFCGDHAQGLQHADEAIRRCTAKAFQAWLAHARTMRGRLRAALGEPQAGLDEMEQGLALWTGTGARITVATYLAFQGEVLLQLGRPEAALHKLQSAQETAQRHGERYYEAELLRLRGWAQWLLHGNEREADQAQEVLRQGLALARAQGNLGLALRSALALAQSLAQRGDPRRAAALLNEALAAVPGQETTDDYRAAQAMQHACMAGAGVPVPARG